MMRFFLRLKKASAILFQTGQLEPEEPLLHAPKLTGISDLDRLSIWTAQQEWLRNDNTRLFFKFLENEREYVSQELENLDMDSAGFERKSRALLARLRTLRSLLRYHRMVAVKVADLQNKCRHQLK